MNPSLPVTYADVNSAAQILSGVVHRTPVLTSDQVNQLTNAHVYFKCENLQRVGAFKFRGAYNAVFKLDSAQKRRGVVAFSTGNHAQAIALAGQMLGVPTIIVMPEDAPKVKLTATQNYGAKVVLYDSLKEDREAIAAKLAQEAGAALIPSFDHHDVIAGQGTAAKELLEEVRELDYLFVPVGGGGLIAGSAIAAAELSPGCKIIGVEPEVSKKAQQSLRSGQIVDIPTPDTIADGARAQHIGKLVLPIMRALVKDVVTVNDDQLIDQIKFFANFMKIIVEPTGCLAAAAVLRKLIDLANTRIGVIISGGNMDTDLLCQCLNTTV